ncbi:MAG: PHP domain-containing protein [Desulfobulbaceae bacterium]|nr:PHP domain-containing protein [Desulfobulbaceae bacterium]
MDAIDLHTHSTCSDGTLTPGEIIELAREKGLKAVALTDHDTTVGIDEALAKGTALGIEVLPGVEISASHGNQAMHLLGYGFRHHDPQLQDRLRVLQTARHDRNCRILANLNALGIPVEWSELPSTTGQIGRPHIARLLTAKGIVKNMDKAFERFLRRGAAAYVHSYRMEADQAIAMISEAGGLAFLAHPASADPKLKAAGALLADLKAMGLAGLELQYPTHTPQTVATLRRLGESLGLLFSGGSDFHGDGRPQIPLGGRRHDPPVHYRLLTAIKDRLAPPLPATAPGIAPIKTNGER